MSSPIRVACSSGARSLEILNVRGSVASPRLTSSSVETLTHCHIVIPDQAHRGRVVVLLTNSGSGSCGASWLAGLAM